jgi:hypothetical protein
VLNLLFEARVEKCIDIVIDLLKIAALLSQRFDLYVGLFRMPISRHPLF